MYRYLGVLALVLLAGAAPAQQTQPQPSAPAQQAAATQAFEVVRAHTDYVVNADGTYDQRNEVIYRVLTPQGVEQLHQAGVTFDTPYQDATIESAFTIKPDGRRIEVPRTKMMEGYGATSTPGFSATKQRMAFYENVEVGDQIGSITRFRQITPWYDGQFQLVMALGRDIAARDVVITLSAPSTMPLKVDVAEFEGGKPETSGGRTHWRWTFHNDNVVPSEQYTVVDWEHTPHVLVTTFADYGAVAAAYRGFSAGKADLDNTISGGKDSAPASGGGIRGLADQLTRGVTDRREIAHRLYDWVSKNIKYVAIVLGNGGLVPHPATDVLAHRYGDCKDHVVLLQALLAAKGIDSTPVLIGLESTYYLPKVAMSQVFDHVITYIPEFQLYLDSTAKFAPFGVLPASDADKPVVNVATGQVMRTPALSPTNATYRETTTVKIAADGSASGETRISATGALATEYRAAMAAVVAGQEQNYIQQARPFIQTASMTRDDPGSLTDPFNINVRYTLSQAATFPGPRGMGFSETSGFHPIYLTGMVAPGWGARRTNYACLALSVDMDTTVEFPASATIVAVPQARQASLEDITISAKYERVGTHTVREIMHAAISHPHAVCTAEYYNRVRGELTKLQAVLNAQIIYQ